MVVGDVSGHGAAAALLMTTARALLRMRADLGGSPLECVADLNRLLNRDVNESGRFLTLFFLRLDAATREIRWVRAGHEPGLRYDPAADRFTELKGDGLALGVVDEFPFEEMSAPPMAPGEIVAVYSDGITETVDVDGDMYGRERLKDFIRANATLSAAELVDGLLADVDEHRDGRPRVDDETLVVVKGV